jgi:surface polysaccharide O-acyltransferase-like enzyme
MYLDILRIDSIGCVICIHVCSKYLKAPSEHFNYFAIGLNTFSKWGVPVFIMISGALLLNGPEGPINRFYRKRLKK